MLRATLTQGRALSIPSLHSSVEEKKKKSKIKLKLMIQKIAEPDKVYHSLPISSSPAFYFRASVHTRCRVGCTRAAVSLAIRECHCLLILTYSRYVYKATYNKSLWHLQCLVICSCFASSRAPAEGLLSHRLIAVSSEKRKLNKKTC